MTVENQLDKHDGRRHRYTFEIYCAVRRHMEELWELVKPVKMPRRRRQDREIPKAA